MSKMTVKCFGVRDYEKPTFDALAEKYDYELVYDSNLIYNENRECGYGFEAIMVRGNCFLNKESITDLKNHGLKYLLTRTAGFNHIDIAGAKELGIPVPFVPGYSPNAISELAVTLTMMLLRNTADMVNKTANELDFKVYDSYFSREIRGCTVGVMGCGRIGCTSGMLYKGLGARVIGYDVFQSDYAKTVFEFKELDDFLKESDIICIHMPYIKGSNEEFVNKALFDKMKDGVIVVNTARGEIMNHTDLIAALESGKVAAYGCDVVSNEKPLFGKKLSKADITDPVHQKLIDMYPRVLITPHVGSATDKALEGMIETSLQNLDACIATGTCKNDLTNK